MKTGFLIGIIIFLVAVAGLVFYLNSQKGFRALPKEEAKRAAEATGEIKEKAPTTSLEKALEGVGVEGNPLEEIPSTNPFEDVPNPFRDSYQNPFK